MHLMDYPILVLLLSWGILFLAAQGGSLLRKVRPISEEEREDFSVALGATLTLLALLIGFSFSMAVSRYDQRKLYEEAEANAIGTEYLRADMLPAEDASKVRALLKAYVDQRVLFYETRAQTLLAKINADTAEIQSKLWSAMHGPARPDTPLAALVVSGMNDVLNSQGYTQAAWWNRIPIAAWALMLAIAICCNLLIGYGARHRDQRILLILPIAVSIAFFLVCDLDCPHGGTIRVVPQNLVALGQGMHPQ